jgi:hypothetical protein
VQKHTMAALAALLASGHLAQAQYMPVQTYAGYRQAAPGYYPTPVIMPNYGWAAGYPVYSQPLPSQSWPGYPLPYPVQMIPYAQSYPMPNYSTAPQQAPTAAKPAVPVPTAQPLPEAQPLLLPKPLPSAPTLESKTPLLVEPLQDPVPAPTLTEKNPAEQNWDPSQPGECTSCAKPEVHSQTHLYGVVEGLFWWTKKAPVPLLVISDTGTLIGDSSFDNQERWGGRVELGGWLDCQQRFGIDAGYFVLGDRHPQALAGSPATSLVARPSFDVGSGLVAPFIVSLPGQAAGNVTVSTFSRLWGADANLRWKALRSDSWDLSLLGGFRYLNLDEGLTVTQSTSVSQPTTILPTLIVPGGTSIALFDQFGTHNQFYGGQLGAAGEWRWKWLFVQARAKVALGSMHEVVEIHGAASGASQLGVNPSVPFGLLAGPASSGHFSHDVFAAVPEGGLDIGVQLTEHLRLHGGYTFLYASNVVRPGDQVTPPSNSVGVLPAAPVTPQLSQADFWAQGVSLGLEIRY